MEAAVRCSPHSTGQDQQRFLLVDVADSSLTLNQVDHLPKKRKGSLEYHAISHYAKLPTFAAFDWSKTREDIVALGLGNGSANLVQLRPQDQGGSETVATYKIKQRQCYSIALSTQDWLALAVDKTRSDVCLFIYDTARPQEASAEPIRRLCAAELVSSVRFFPSQPQEIVAGTQKAFIRLYDLRDGSAAQSSNVGTAQAPTKNVNNIAIDPLDENYFASAGSTGDPSVTVWDKRWLAPPASSSSSLSSSTTGAVFDFRPAVNNSVKTTVWSLRYSGQRRGRLAMCSSTGEVSIIDMIEGPNTSTRNLDHQMNGSAGLWSCNRYVSERKTLETAYHDAKYGRESKTRIIAYDWSNEIMHDSAQAMMVLRPNRKVEMLRVPTAKAVAGITVRQDLALAYGAMTVTEPKASIKHAPASTAPYERTNTPSAEDFGPLEYAGEDEAVDENADSVGVCNRNSPLLQRVLAPGTLQADRCRRGYLFDCQKNMQIVAGNWQLERLWEIVGRFEDAAKDGMVSGNLDLSYVGISGLWSESPGASPHRKLTPSAVKPAKAIVGLNAAKAIPAFEGERTHFPEHRQLCLMLCGWKFTVETLEAECQELIDRGLYYQAIVQAVLHGYKHIALNLLRTLIRSRIIQNIGLGALLASNDINEEQREMCMWMAADTDDPALKALLTFLNTGHWRDIMKTNYLHLGYRLALGLKYLNDTELSGFLQSETARAVKNGDLEGILLTGLGEQAMDLFQTYIIKTNDLQTAVLATAFTVPRYVHDDARWEMWRETYCGQMLAWRCGVQKARFVVRHNRMAKVGKEGGRSLLATTPGQVELSCLHCQASLARPEHSHIRTHARQASEALQNGERRRIEGPAAYAGTVCPRCGRHLPRCGICLLWLGTATNLSSSTPSPSLGIDVVGGDMAKEDGIMAKLLSFCVSCGHGHHADHAKMWFATWDMCPVPDCRCMCGLT